MLNWHSLQILGGLDATGHSISVKVLALLALNEPSLVLAWFWSIATPTFVLRHSHAALT